jgi:hypothetical protein
MARSYTLCTGESKGKICPISEFCERFCPTMVKAKTIHFDPIPYNFQTNKCNQYLFEPPINGDDNHEN